MPSGNDRRVFPPLHLLAGLEMGTVGGLAALAWLGLYSAFRGQSFWAFANLLATTFYGDGMLDRGLGTATLSGVALQLVGMGLAGSLFGICSGRFQGGRRSLLAGIIFGVVWYYLGFRWVWNHWNLLVPLYSPDRAVLFAHLLFGACLGAIPRVARGLADGEDGLGRM